MDQDHGDLSGGDPDCEDQDPDGTELGTMMMTIAETMMMTFTQVC